MLRDGADDLVGAGDLDLCEVLESGTRQVSASLRLDLWAAAHDSLECQLCGCSMALAALCKCPSDTMPHASSLNACHSGQVVEVPLTKAGRELGQLELCIQVRRASRRWGIASFWSGVWRFCCLWYTVMTCV